MSFPPPVPPPPRRVKPVPVVPVLALAETERDVATTTIAWSLPASVVVRHSLDVIGGWVTRTVSDAGGLLEQEVVPLDHACLTCALRHEIVPTLRRLATTGRWQHVVLSLPPASPARALLNSLRAMLGPRSGVRVANPVASIDGAALVADLFGDDLLRERDEALHAGDIRAVGEVLAEIVEHAGVVVAPELDPHGRGVVEEIAQPDAVLSGDATALDPRVWLTDRTRGDWVDLTTRTPAGGAPTDAESPVLTRSGGGVWSVYVDTWRPFHPQRLLASIESLGGHSYLGRGCFWLPTHPDSLAEWAGSGGQLSIGTVTGRPARGPRTRIVITGVDDRAEVVRSDLSTALLTEAELVAGLARWIGKEDGFEPWLGERQASA